MNQRWWVLYHYQLAVNWALSAEIEFRISYRRPTPASTFLVYHRLERWGA